MTETMTKAMNQAENVYDNAKAAVDQVRENVMTTGRTQWLAGLGVVATAQDQGRKVFDEMVEKGKSFEVQEPSTMVGKAMDQAQLQVKSVRQSIETNINEASRVVLHRMGLPSHDEIQSLISRVEQLTLKVEALGKKEAR